MTNRRRLTVGAAALVAIACVVTAVAIARHAPTVTAARTPDLRGTPAPPSAAQPLTVPTTTAPSPEPTPGEPLTVGDGRVLDFVATLPTVRDVTQDTVAEFTDLVCTTLRSPKMSPSFFDQVLAVEEQSYSLTRAQATGLLMTVARSDCPEAVRVVDSAGADASVAPSN